MKIRFLKNTKLKVNNTVITTYEDTYKKDEEEYVDLIDESPTHIHIQFRNGETAAIPRDSIVFISYRR